MKRKHYSRTSSQLPKYEVYPSKERLYAARLEELFKKAHGYRKSGKWERKEEKNGCQVLIYNVPNSYAASMGLRVIKSALSAKDFLDFTHNISLNPKFRDVRKELEPKIVFYESLHDFDNGLSNLCHFRFSSGKRFISDRDFILLRKRHHDLEKNVSYMYGGSFDTNKDDKKAYPTEKGCVRSEVFVFMWSVSKPTPDTLRVEYFTHSSPGGYIPKALFNLTVKEKALCVLHFSNEFMARMSEKEKQVIEERKKQEAIEEKKKQEELELQRQQKLKEEKEREVKRQEEEKRRKEEQERKDEEERQRKLKEEKEREKKKKEREERMRRELEEQERKEEEEERKMLLLESKKKEQTSNNSSSGLDNSINREEENERIKKELELAKRRRKERAERRFREMEEFISSTEKNLENEISSYNEEEINGILKLLENKEVEEKVEEIKVPKIISNNDEILQKIDELGEIVENLKMNMNNEEEEEDLSKSFIWGTGIASAVFFIGGIASFVIMGKIM